MTRNTPVRPTRFLPLPDLAAELGCQEIVLADETQQVTHSFKFRAAWNVVSSMPNMLFITASSGNFGAALAKSCQMLGRNCIVVMPETSAESKVRAVTRCGFEVVKIDTAKVSRIERLNQLAAEHPEAYVVSPFDDDLVIGGNASLGLELARRESPLDCVIVPIGGGGLASGIISGLREFGSGISVYGAEPLLANDAARSLRAGEIVANAEEPPTLADGARTLSVGARNWPYLKEGLRGMIEVTEEAIAGALRRCFADVRLLVEPTGALALAALLSEPAEFKDKRVCCVVSGANVDARRYAEILLAPANHENMPMK